jgi:hypothetical protein
VIKRSSGTCLPIPHEVLQTLQAGEDLSTLTQNVEEAQEPHRSYCVRCCVYRSSFESLAFEARQRRAGGNRCPMANDMPAHHCRTCQRCVAHFDHHCSVFGRCIAGKGFGGNMGYFKVIIVCAQLGPFTTAGTVGGGLIAKFGWFGIAIIAAIVAGLCVIGCFVGWAFAAMQARNRQRRRQTAARARAPTPQQVTVVPERIVPQVPSGPNNPQQAAPCPSPVTAPFLAAPPPGAHASTTSTVDCTPV